MRNHLISNDKIANKENIYYKIEEELLEQENSELSKVREKDSPYIINNNSKSVNNNKDSNISDDEEANKRKSKEETNKTKLQRENGTNEMSKQSKTLNFTNSSDKEFEGINLLSDEAVRIKIKEAIKEEKLLPLSSDIVFKRVFAKEGNEDLLKDFIEGILKRKIKYLVVKNPELSQNLYNDKEGVLDVKAELDDGTICDIEMQVKDEKNISKRSLWYGSTLLSEQIKRGDNYRNLNKVIVINILNFNYFERNSYHNIARMKFEKSSEEAYVDLGITEEEKYATEDIEMHFIELPKFRRKDPEVASKLEQWLWLISGNGGKIVMAEKKNEKISDALDEIKMLSMNEQEWNLYMSRLRSELDYNTAIIDAKEEGEAHGRREGEKKATRQVAAEMLKKNMPIDIISEVTKLSKEEIKKIEEEIKAKK